MVAVDLDGALNFLDPVYALHSFDEVHQPLAPFQQTALLLG